MFSHYIHVHEHLGVIVETDQIILTKDVTYMCIHV